MLTRLALLFAATLLLTGPAATAQQRPVAKSSAALKTSFFTTYGYVSYAILDQGTSAKPQYAQGVGGTLTLHPDGTYQKRLQLAGAGGISHFDQDGRFTFAGNQITFSFTDAKGQARLDQGTFRLQPAVGLLTLTIKGYPAGNQGVYTLRAQ